MTAFMFLKIDRPCSTAATIVEKLSLANTISEASLATSVPPMPMATPMSACFRAGASFTPSPVIATISSCSFNIFTTICLCLGSMREKTAPSLPRSAIMLFSTSARSAWDMSANSLPVRDLAETSESGARIPSCREMASAVTLLSPVVMKTLMPALLHAAIASIHSGRGGSMIPTRPTNTMPCSTAAKPLGSQSTAWPGWDGPS
mmetsp:Transcript_33721/g.80868  ORF Transcript_33721/g.80868 Transcript_33721/m.80868 type:complete len:204 (+) Transcript_33721:797-1408(+)